VAWLDETPDSGEGMKQDRSAGGNPRVSCGKEVDMVDRNLKKSTPCDSPTVDCGSSSG